MVNVSIARRYARALLDVAAEAGNLDALSEQLSAFVRAMQGSPDLSGILLNPAFSRAQRTSVVEAVLESGKFALPLANLIRLLVDRNRLVYLPDISRLFNDMADQRAGRVKGKVTSAVPLSKEAVERLSRSLEVITQRKVQLEQRVDPSLLGGVSAQVGSVVYDGSLRSQLEELRRTLAQR
jgi:F-type H+-transporting ATPase subunit delta